MIAPRPTKLRSQRDINLWRIPLLLSLAAVALFGLTLIPDILDKYGYIHIPSWLTMGSIDDARSILSATMGAVATVLALIFSVALLVLSMVATLFGPRLLYRFLQDWVTQVTVGGFMATFVYLCLVFLVTHQDSASSFVPQISLLTSWVLVVASFGFLVYYSHRIASSIQNPDLVGRIADDVYPAARSAHACAIDEGRGTPPDDAAIAADAEAGADIACANSGYFQHVDHHALVVAAQRVGAKVILSFRPGQFVLRGERIAAVHPRERGAALEAAIDKAVKIGRHRTLTQDSEFAIAQIVEIAIRALSPAVNDTFTGVACVDWLGDALLALADEPPPRRQLVRRQRRAPAVDAGGQARSGREARVRPDPTGLGDDAGGADPPARAHHPARAADACGGEASPRGSSSGDPRDRSDRARRARSSRHRCRMATRDQGAGSVTPRWVAPMLLQSLVARADAPDDRHVSPCRPTVTCTADLAPPGTLEIELGDQLRRVDNGGALEETTPFLVKLPLAHWVEVQLGGNGYTVAPGAHYFDNATVGAKLHVVDQGGQRPSLALTVTASIPTVAQRGYTRSYELFAVAHASKDYGKVHLDWNVGLALLQLEGSVVTQRFTAIAASYPLTGRLSATVEPHYFSDADPAAPRDIGAIAAIGYTIRPWLVLDGAVDVVFADQASVAGLAGVSIAPVRLWGGR